MQTLVPSCLAIALLALTPAHAQDAAPAGKAQIGAWGVDTAGLSRTVAPGDDALAIDAYEAGRPSAAIACRFGDARFLAAGS